MLLRRLSRCSVRTTAPVKVCRGAPANKIVSRLGDLVCRVQST